MKGIIPGEGHNYMTQHTKVVLLSQKFKIHFLLSFSLILVQKCLRSDIVFLRYGNFIVDVITDWWKVASEKKGSSSLAVAVLNYC